MLTSTVVMLWLLILDPNGTPFVEAFQHRFVFYANNQKTSLPLLRPSPFYPIPRGTLVATAASSSKSEEPHVETLLFVECGTSARIIPYASLSEVHARVYTCAGFVIQGQSPFCF